MNVNDRWMLEQMQQMAAAMAVSVPQAGQTADAPKTEKGESFQDMMDKAVKGQKAESPEKADAAQKPEKPEAAQETEEAEAAQENGLRKAETVETADGAELRKVNLTALEAAMVAAGYAALSPVQPDGTVWLAVFVGEGGAQSNPLADQIILGVRPTGMAPDFSAYFVDDEWVIEPSEEFTAALEQLLVKTGDSRSAEEILSGLEEKFQDIQPKLEIVVRNPEPEQTDDQEDNSLDASVMTAGRPLFRDVKAAPVKVGENFQLDTRQPEMDDQLAETIRYAAQEGLRQIEVRLSPENLGNLTIKLTQGADGVLQVVFHAATPRAAAILNQHMDGLNTLLQGYGQTETRVEVQRTGDSQQAQQQHQQTDPNGHNRQQQQQQRQEQHTNSQDFIQRLRLGLFELEDVI